MLPALVITILPSAFVTNNADTFCAYSLIKSKQFLSTSAETISADVKLRKSSISFTTFISVNPNAVKIFSITVCNVKLPDKLMPIGKSLSTTSQVLSLPLTLTVLLSASSLGLTLSITPVIATFPLINIRQVSSGKILYSPTNDFVVVKLKLLQNW